MLNGSVAAGPLHMLLADPHKVASIKYHCVVALEPRSSNRRPHDDFSMCGGSDRDERASRFRNGSRGDVVA
jgi:hypothetical protein